MDCVKYGDPILENKWVTSANLPGQTAHIMKPDVPPVSLKGYYTSGSYGFCGPFAVSHWYLVEDHAKVGKYCKVCKKAADIRYNPLERLVRET